MNPDRFLSLRVNPSRVARVTWVLVVCGLAIIPLAYGVRAGVSLALFAAYLGAYRLLRARASRIPIPSLPETETSFEVRLPKAQLPCLKSATLAMLALSVLACGTALFAPLAAPSLRPDPLEFSALTIGLPLFVAAVLPLALVYPLAKNRQEAPLSVGSQNGTVFVTYLLKRNGHEEYNLHFPVPVYLSIASESSLAEASVRSICSRKICQALANGCMCVRR